MGTLKHCDRENLLIEIDKQTGNIVRMHDRKTNQTIIDGPPEWEMQVNRHPVELKLVHHDDEHGMPQSVCRVDHYAGYSQGWALRLARLMTPGERCLHISYRLKRVLMEHCYPTPGPNAHDMEVPLYVETIGLLGWRWSVLGEGTRMRIFHLSGGGPFEHMSVEDGPVKEVNARLWHLMRRTYPGVQTIPGVIYYRTDPPEWVFIYCRRSPLSYIADYTDEGIRFHFQYHRAIKVGDEFPVPEIAVRWGRDLEEMEQLIADQFSVYEEPPDWAYHTVWAMMASGGPNPRSFDYMGDLALECIERAGVRGFWLYTHHKPSCDIDTSPAGHGPNPECGTHKQFKKMVDRIHRAGGKVKVWMSASGLRPWYDIRPEWAIRGIDGTHWVSWTRAEHEFIVACNPLDEGYRNYMLEWTRRYVEDFDVDSFFLDCGVFTFPCDFSPHRPASRFPSENGPAMRELMEQMWSVVQEAKPDNFHMWYEGFHSEYPGTGYCHGTMVFPPPAPEALTSQRMLHQIVKRGKRLVWGTLHPFDLACGMVQCNPLQVNSIEAAREMAADPMNQFIAKLVTEQGVRDALGITDGVSWLNDYIVTVPDYKGTTTIPDEGLQNIKGVEDVHSAEKLEAGRAEKGRPTLELKGGSAYKIIW